MAELDNDKKRHFILEGFAETEQFQSPQQGGGRPNVPEQERGRHGAALRRQIQELKARADRARQAQEAVGLEDGIGLQIEFESFPEVELAFESLARERSGIELLNVRHENEKAFATVFVPEGKLAHFERLIQEYLEEKRDKAGRSRDHRLLLDTIQEIRAASLRALWTDDPTVFPASDDEVLWWEVWLPVRGDRARTLDTFRMLAEGQGIRIALGTIEFPERTVLLVYSSVDRMKQSMLTLNGIAELRRAKETAEFFDSLPPAEQPEWMDQLLERTQFPGEEAEVSYVCILDTGVNRGHPIIRQALATLDLHTVDPAWGVDDEHGHGTSMAGLALVGDLTHVLAGDEPVVLDHRLESVKLLPEDGGNAGDPQHHGYLTIQGVARPEITAPYRHRVFGMMVTTRDHRDRGRPSAWSSALDRLASDADGQGENPRLFVVAAGNIDDPNAWITCPDSNSTDGVHDPAQAWNVLTVGAFTEHVRITEPDTDGYQPIATMGGLSPFSTTSSTWQNHWPLKPDVVFEGGNAAKDKIGAVWMPSLSLLTAYHKPQERLFTTTNATSAATALAVRMAVQLATIYPELWAETVRALMVHSAKWTNAMQRSFLPKRNPSKSDYANLVRHCGFGVPDLDRALWSAADSLTLIVQERVHPFRREGSREPTLRDMHLHRLPWPLAELEALGEVPVEMRVTLSYFVEPNPSARGVRSRYRYESHGLRFEVKRPLEPEADFRSRINAAARDEEESTHTRGDDPHWMLGKHQRHKGSLHSDIWWGTAAELASRGIVAVYPSLGWWKTRPRLERYNNVARYSLVVSIRAPETDVDLYTAVANLVDAAVAVRT